MSDIVRSRRPEKGYGIQKKFFYCFSKQSMIPSVLLGLASKSTSKLKFLMALLVTGPIEIILGGIFATPYIAMKFSMVEGEVKIIKSAPIF